MKTVREFLEETQLYERTRQDFAKEHTGLPPLLVQLNGGKNGPAEDDTARVQTVVMNLRDIQQQGADILENPIYRVEKNLDVNPLGMFITLGRAQNCDIIFPNNQVSKLHAMIRQTENGYEFADWKSSNGTRMLIRGDDVPCEPQKYMPLEDRCVVVLGSKLGAVVTYLETPVSVYDFLSDLR